MNDAVRCPELVSATVRDRFDRHRHERLHPNGRRLIGDWFQRAQEQLNCDPADSFEPFIYAWIAFNGWASCCTDLDRDRQIIEALSQSPELSERFDQSIAESGAIRTSAKRFRSLWPVFKVQNLRRRHIPIRHNDLDRQRMIARYFEQGADRFEPLCYRRHVDNGEEVPLDWPHVLFAIYQVRCNLFHGDKGAHSEIDRVLVHSAFQTLVQFLGKLWIHALRYPLDANAHRGAVLSVVAGHPGWDSGRESQLLNLKPVARRRWSDCSDDGD